MLNAFHDSTSSSTPNATIAIGYNYTDGRWNRNTVSIENNSNLVYSSDIADRYKYYVFIDIYYRTIFNICPIYMSTRISQTSRFGGRLSLVSDRVNDREICCF